MPHGVELFFEGNEFASLSDFARKVCDSLTVQPVQASDSYVVCQTLGVRVVLSMANPKALPYCNYRISVENKSAQEVPFSFVADSADRLTEKLVASGLVILQVQRYAIFFRRVLRFALDKRTGKTTMVEIRSR